MFWILAAIAGTILSWVWFNKDKDLSDLFVGKAMVSIGGGLMILLIGVLVSAPSHTNSEVLFHYTEKVGTENTSWIKDSNIAYIDSKGEFKNTTLEMVNVKKLNGELYLDYSVVRSWNDSFWKFDMEEFTENVIVTME